MWLPIDDALIAGPEGGLADVRGLLSPAVTTHLDAVLGFRGVIAHCDAELATLPVIINVSGSTTRGRHLDKVLVTSVEAAVGLGADAVAFHINIGAPTEGAMLARLGKVVDAAEPLGMPVVVIAYPRSEDSVTHEDDNHLSLREKDPGAYAKLVRQTVRIGVELGATVVKAVYTGHEETFAEVVDAALGVPVVMAGGPKEDDEAAWLRSEAAVRAGAAGVAFGRQVFLNPDPSGFLSELRTRMDSAARTQDAAGSNE